MYSNGVNLVDRMEAFLWYGIESVVHPGIVNSGFRKGGRRCFQISYKESRVGNIIFKSEEVLTYS